MNEYKKPLVTVNPKIIKEYSFVKHDSEKKKTLESVGIIGACQGPFTADMYPNMKQKTLETINNRFHLESFGLISGGSSWCDHIAVQLFLGKKCDYLRLHLPCDWDVKNKKFTGNNYGGYLNKLHQQFSLILGINTLHEIDQAIRTPGCEYFSCNGFAHRNRRIADDSVVMIALSWSPGNKPLKGGTKMTWNLFRARNSNGVHINLDSFKKTEEKPTLKQTTLKRKIEE